MALNSCQKLELQLADTNVPVVESYLQPGGEVCVKIVKQLVFNSDADSTVVLDSLLVTLSDSTNSWVLENTGKGYYLNSTVAIETGTGYCLTFEYNNKTVTASTSIPSKPVSFEASDTSIEAFTMDHFTLGTEPEMPDPITLSWSNDEGDYYMIVVENIENTLELIDSNTDRPVRKFRNVPTQGSETELDAQTFMYYGTHRIILYHLNSEYAALYEQLSRSSLDITAPPSNVENGLGIFTGINSDTLFVEVI